MKNPKPDITAQNHKYPRVVLCQMTFREPEETDKLLIFNLLNIINIAAPDCHAQGVQDIAIYDSYIIGENGFLTIIKIPDGFLSFLSFEDDIDNPELFEEIIEKLLAIEIEEGKYLFITVNGENRNLIDHFETNGFAKSSDGLEFMLDETHGPEQKPTTGQKTSAAPSLPAEIEIRSYDIADIEEYIWLFDKAYETILIAEGHKQNPHSRNKERTHEMLANAEEDGNFGSFWLEGKLIGAYILQRPVILNIAIFPLYQRQGYGSRMLAHILSGIEGPVLLYISRGNDIAQKFVEKHGFKQKASHVDMAYLGGVSAP